MSPGTDSPDALMSRIVDEAGFKLKPTDGGGSWALTENPVIEVACTRFSVNGTEGSKSSAEN